MEVAPTVAPAAEAPAPPKPQFPRYHYLSPPAPPAGDRAAAAPAYAEGAQAQRQGNFAAAERAYRRAVALAPDYFDAWFSLGMVAHEVADWPRALAADEQALAIKPGDANARYNFALALARAGYPVDAAAELERLLGSRPAFTEAHLSLAGICADPLGDRARAREHQGARTGSAAPAGGGDSALAGHEPLAVWARRLAVTCRRRPDGGPGEMATGACGHPRL